MKYHILMPFQRIENKNEIVEYFSKFNVILHPIISKSISFPKFRWIEPFEYYLPEDGVNLSYYYALNKFIQKGEINDNDYYMFLTDQDILEPGFFNKLRWLRTDFAVVSMKRGNERTYFPSWRNMGRQGMSGQQLVIKGKRLKNEKFVDTHIADAKFVSSLWTRYPHADFTFVNDANVLFNYLDPERWKPDTLWKPA